MPRTRTLVSQRRAFTMTEVLFSMIIVLIMALMFAAIIPAASRNSRYSSDYEKAVTLVMHKINQLQELGYTEMNGPALGQNNHGVVDGTPNNPATNDDGAATATFEFSETDQLWTYFPGGKKPDGTRQTSGNIPRGYLYLAPYSSSQFTTSGGTDAYGLIRATVAVSWWNSRGKKQYYAATTLIPKTLVK